MAVEVAQAVERREPNPLLFVGQQIVNPVITQGIWVAAIGLVSEVVVTIVTKGAAPHRAEPESAILVRGKGVDAKLMPYAFEPFKNITLPLPPTQGGREERHG